MECLATRAEALIGKPCRLADTAGLALELVGLLWPVLGAAETVAATCRASLLLGAPGVVMSTAPADQVQEIATRLDAIWEAAQNDPAAGVVELPQPLLVSAIRSVPAELPAAVEPELEPAVEPEPLVDEVIEALVEPEPLLPVVITEQQWEPDPDELPAAWRNCAEPIEPPAPKKRRRTGPIPPGWWSAEDLADLLNVDSSSVCRWRRIGGLGADGTDWGKFGHVYAYSPELVADLEQGGIKNRLKLVAAGLSHCL
jgi:hypothetical protein